MENMKNQAVNDEELEQVSGGFAVTAVDDPTQRANAAAVLLANLDVLALDREVADSLYKALGTTAEAYQLMSYEEKVNAFGGLSSALVRALLIGSGDPGLSHPMNVFF